MFKSSSELFDPISCAFFLQMMILTAYKMKKAERSVLEFEAKEASLVGDLERLREAKKHANCHSRRYKKKKRRHT